MVIQAGYGHPSSDVTSLLGDICLLSALQAGMPGSMSTISAKPQDIFLLEEL